MEEFLITVLAITACILLFSLAIFIHEFGHFLAAKLLGFQVDTFSIGFGPALWKKTYKGVEYRVSAIPFGGYVALPQLDPAGTAGVQGSQADGGEDGGERGGEPVAPMENWKKIVVAFAGPFGNIVLAVALAFLLSVVPWARFGALTSEVGGVFDDGPAAKGGMKAGDRVLSVNGNPVKTWSDLLTEVQIVGEREAAVEVDRGGTNLVLRITPERDKITGGCLIMAHSVTNSKPCSMWMPDRNPLKQLAWDAGAVGRVLRALVTPKESGAVAKSIGGPFMIAEGIYHQVRNDGWDAIGFLRMINVNLAVLNLLPIPVLDGGLILFSLIAIVMRRPVPRKIVDGLSMVFMYLILALMLTLVWRDISRSVRVHKAKGELEKILKQEEARRIWLERFKPAFDLGAPTGGGNVPCPSPDKD